MYDMNTEALELLNKILQKQLHDLTPEDISFLKARRDYLNPVQLSTYKDLIEVKAKQESAVPTYSQLLAQAKDMGYVGPKMKMNDLKAWIEARK